MFRTRICSAPLIVPSKVAVQTVAIFKTLSRLVGGVVEPFGTIESYDAILSKAPKCVPAKIGRAVTLMDHGADKKAIEMLNTVEADPKSDFGRMVAALRAKSAMKMLDSARVKVNASGAANEKEIANMLEEAETALNAWTKVDDSWGAALASAEFYLSLGGNRYASAMESFKAAAEGVKKEATASSDVASVTAENTVAFKIRYQRIAEQQHYKFNSSALSESVKPEIGELAAVKSALASTAPGITDAEAADLACVVSSAQTKHHYLELFARAEYGPWKSAYATELHQKIAQFLAPSHCCSSEQQSLFNAIGGLKKNDKKAFTEIVSNIESHFQKFPSIMRGTNDKYFEELAAEVIEQIPFRCQAGIGVALHKTGKTTEATATFKQIVEADKYIDMWKVLYGQANLFKDLNLVTESDSFFRHLHELKAHKLDIPLQDENRTISAY